MGWRKWNELEDFSLNCCKKRKGPFFDLKIPQGTYTSYRVDHQCQSPTGTIPEHLELNLILQTLGKKGSHIIFGVFALDQ